MLGQREKIIVIHLKSVLDFDLEVIQGHLWLFWGQIDFWTRDDDIVTKHVSPKLTSSRTE